MDLVGEFDGADVGTKEFLRWCSEGAVVGIGVVVVVVGVDVEDDKLRKAGT